MAQTLELNPSVIDSAMIEAPEQRRVAAVPVVPDAIVEENSKPSALDVAAAEWRRDTVLGSIYGYGGGPMWSINKDWNPYSFYTQNEDEFKDLEPWIRKGAFGNTSDEDSFRHVAASIRQQVKDLHTIAAGGAMGNILGTAASLLDVTSLIPFAGEIRGAGLLTRIGAGAAGGAAYAGVQETALHALQQTRTRQESYLNIGVGAALGGGIGALANIWHPKSELNPEAKKNALDVTDGSKSPTGIYVPGDPLSQADVFGSVGAAKSGEGSKLAYGNGVVGKVANAVDKVLTGVTPLGRLLHARSDKARKGALDLMDSGGSITKFNREGLATEASAEDIRNDFMMRTYDFLLNHLDDTRFNLNKELGGSTGRFRSNLSGDAQVLSFGKYRGNPIDNNLFDQIIERKARDDWHQETGTWRDYNEDWLRQALTDRGYDPDVVAPIVHKWTDKAVSSIHDKSALMEQEMIHQGMLDPDKALGKEYGLAQIWNANAETRNKLEAFMLNVFSKKPPEEWLSENYGKSLKDFEAMAYDDPQRLEIMDTWVGDKRVADTAAADSRVRIAKQEFEARMLDLNSAAHAEGLVKDSHKKAKLKAVQAAARESEAKIARNRLTTLRERVLHAENTAQDLKSEVNRLNAERQAGKAEMRHIKSGVSAFEEDLSRLKNRESRESRKADAIGARVDDVVAAGMPEITTARGSDIRKLNSAQAKFDNLMGRYEEALRRVEDTRSAYAAEKTKALGAKRARRLSEKDISDIEKDVAARKGELKGTQKLADLEKRTRTIQKAQERLERLQAKAAEAEAARKAMWDELKDMRSGLSLSKAEMRKALRELKRSARAQKNLANSQTIVDYVHELIDRMVNHDVVPWGQLQKHVGESGRVKDRVINLSPDELRVARDEGLLNTNLRYLLERQHTDTAARLALKEKFGDVELKAYLKEVDDDYAAMVNGAKDAKTQASLRAEQAQVRRDLIAGRDRLLGRSQYPRDNVSLATWGANKLRQSSFIRFAAGFVINNITDLASYHLRVGLGRDLKVALKGYRKMLMSAGVDPKSDELLSLVRSAEMMFSRSRSANVDYLEDLHNQFGAGERGTFKNKVTGRIDRALGFLTDRMNAYTGQAGWNNTLKATAGLTQMANLRRWVRNYGSLSKSQKTDLASLGIDESAANRLNHYFEKYGEERDGLFDPNSYRWHGESDGADMDRLLRIAVRRTMDRAIMSPGAGDAPLLMSKPMGAMFLQFATFGFVMMQKFLRPVTQRIVLDHDQRALESVATALSLGALVTQIRAYMNGTDTSKWQADEWTKNILDRSGLMAYLSPYVDGSLKLLGPTLNQATGTSIFTPTSRFSQNNWWESFLGPWFGTLDTAGSAATALARGDTDKTLEKIGRLAPFMQWYRIANALHNQVSQ